MSWWMPINKILTPRRLTYAWIAGAAMWIAWLISATLGPGNIDLAGQVAGTDYLQFYASGLTIRQGDSAHLYDFAYQSNLEQSIAGPGLTAFHAYLTTPYLAWFFVPLTLLPYSWSFVAWSIVGLLFLWMSINLITAQKSFKSFLWCLTWFPIFASISFGQNSLMSLFLLSLSFWLWRKEKYLAAGLVSSLLLYKPQLVLGVGILWLLEWRRNWKSLLGLAAGGAGLAGLCFWLLPEASVSYLHMAREFLPRLIYNEEFPLWHLHSLRGFWILLFPGNRTLSEVLSLVLSLIGVLAFYQLWRKKHQESEFLFAGAICLTIWISPHAMIYDWSILLIPALIFWRSYPEKQSLWKAIFAIIWVATFISGPLTFEQQKILPGAIQISVPLFLLVLLTTYRSLAASNQGLESPK